MRYYLEARDGGGGTAGETTAAGVMQARGEASVRAGWGAAWWGSLGWSLEGDGERGRSTGSIGLQERPDGESLSKIIFPPGSFDA